MKCLCRLIANFTVVGFYVLGTESLDNVYSPECKFPFEAKKRNYVFGSNAIFDFLRSFIACLPVTCTR